MTPHFQAGIREKAIDTEGKLFIDHVLFRLVPGKILDFFRTEAGLIHPKEYKATFGDGLVVSHINHSAINFTGMCGFLSMRTPYKDALLQLSEKHPDGLKISNGPAAVSSSSYFDLAMFTRAQQEALSELPESHPDGIKILNGPAIEPDSFKFDLPKLIHAQTDCTRRDQREALIQLAGWRIASAAYANDMGKITMPAPGTLDWTPGIEFRPANVDDMLGSVAHFLSGIDLFLEQHQGYTLQINIVDPREAVLQAFRISLKSGAFRSIPDRRGDLINFL